jgi:hypothetical protein
MNMHADENSDLRGGSSSKRSSTWRWRWRCGKRSSEFIRCPIDYLLNPEVGQLEPFNLQRGRNSAERFGRLPHSDHSSDGAPLAPIFDELFVRTNPPTERNGTAKIPLAGLLIASRHGMRSRVRSRSASATADRMVKTSLDIPFPANIAPQVRPFRPRFTPYHALYVGCREKAEREASPTARIVDSQSVKSAEKPTKADARSLVGGDDQARVRVRIR